MKLRYYFLILALAVAVLAAVTLFATFRSHHVLFYFTEGFVVLLLAYLWHVYHKTIRPYDTLISGMELVRDLDLTTRLAPSGQHETDVIVRTFNELLNRLRNEHLSLEEQYTFLSLLIEASPMGVIQCDIDGHITSMNRAARDFFSPTVEAALLSLPLGESTTVRLHGAPQLFRISHHSFPDRGYRHPFFLIESLTDEVRRAEKDAYERVIRMMAHEVNNSVAGILSGWDVLDEKREKASVCTRLSALSTFVTRFAEVVKIPQPHLQLCDLSEEVEACRPFLENLCLTAHVCLELRLTDEAIPVSLDPILFQQVLVNIVKNSIEGIEDLPPTLRSEGAITVAVETMTTHSASSLSGTERGGALIVTDNGRGIPPDVAPHLFTPFFSTKPQGQGLGLLLIRDILTAHRCTFSLKTDSTDHLTRFTILFPA